MFVSDILAQKGGLVYTVTPGTSIAQLSQQLSTRRIGSVLVLDGEGSVAGIVSERDLVRALASHGAASATCRWSAVASFWAWYRSATW